MTIYEYNARLDAAQLPILAEGKKYNIDGRVAYSNPDMLADLAGNTIGLRAAAEEYAWCIVFNAKQKIIGLFEAGHGTISSSVVDIRGILQKTLLLGGSRVALAHNHPTGDSCPSDLDRTVTERIKQAAELCGIDFIDHIVIGDGNYYSFAGDCYGRY